MSALLAVTEHCPPQAFERARAELDGHGLGSPRALQCGSARVLWYPGAFQDEADGCLAFPDGFIACVGTLFHQGRTGRAALESLWQSFTTPEALGRDDPWGSHALAIAKGGRLWLLCDRLGMLKFYERPQAGLFSTSWLACVAAGSRNTLDTVGALDYVLSGASHGLATPVAEVRTVDPATAVDVLGGGRIECARPAEWLSHALPRSQDEALDEAVDLLAGRARAVASAFGARIRCALSGGFDSRLLLASLRHVGAHPALHVYGGEQDEDVRIGKGIAGRLGLEMHHVDKSARNQALPALTAHTLEARLRFFDGLPIDGIFDRGADCETRLAQSAGGSIALNGGGGEVLRNFFYLSNRPYSVRQIVQTFYGNHDPRVARNPGDLAGYLDYLGGSIARQIGHGGRLSRPELEAVYPLFRGRFWTGRNNVMAARCGHFLTPLLDPALVRLSLALPLAWKDYGRFEGRLIARLDPLLADLPLSYGFTPRQGPGRAYAARMWLEHRRPPWLRARTVWLKRLAGRLPPPVASEEILRLLPGHRRTEDLVDTGRLVDEGQLERTLTLEYLVRRHAIG